jgi:DNA-binding MarR family transcriptional regulator
MMADRNLSDALHLLVHAYKSHLRRAVQADGVSLPGMHIRALKSIASASPATALTVAQRLRRDKGQVARVLADLEASGLIARRENPLDRRSQLLELGADARALLARIAVFEDDTARRMTRGLSGQEVQQFMRLAQQMADNLNEPH